MAWAPSANGTRTPPRSRGISMKRGLVRAAISRASFLEGFTHGPIGHSWVLQLTQHTKLYKVLRWPERLGIGGDDVIPASKPWVHRLGLSLAAILLIVGLAAMAADAVHLRLWDCKPGRASDDRVRRRHGYDRSSSARLALYGLIRAIGWVIWRLRGVIRGMAMRRAMLVAVRLLCTVALTGCSDADADYWACQAKAYDVFKQSIWKSDDALEYVRVCMMATGYEMTPICLTTAKEGGKSLSSVALLPSCFERSWWKGWRRVIY